MSVKAVMRNLTSVCGFVKGWYGQVEQLRLGYVIRTSSTSIGQFLRCNQMQTTQIITADNNIVFGSATSRNQDHRIQVLFVKHINTSFTQRPKISSFSRMWDLRGRGLLLIHGHKINAL